MNKIDQHTELTWPGSAIQSTDICFSLRAYDWDVKKHVMNEHQCPYDQPQPDFVTWIDQQREIPCVPLHRTQREGAHLLYVINMLVALLCSLLVH